MNSLHWSLLIGAIALIAAVLVLNSLQYWKRRSRGEKTLNALREVIGGRRSASNSIDPEEADGYPVAGRHHAESANRESSALGGFSGSSETLLRASRLEPTIPPVRANKEQIPAAHIQRPTGAPTLRTASSKEQAAESKPSLVPREEGDVRDEEKAEGPEIGQPDNISEPILDLKQWSRAKPWVGIDDRVDLIVGLETWQGWQGERILQAFQGLRRVGTKPLLLEAQVLSDPQEAWVPVVPGLRFVRLRLGLLLANRSGPLKPTEYSDFLSALQSVRDLLQASWTDGTTPANMHEVIDRARRVDAHCAGLDVQVVINLALGEAISPISFSKMGSSLGLVDRGNTRQALLTPQGIELFSMTLGSKPDWVTFMLDVPRSPMDESPWQKMMDCAATAVGRFGGQLLDDHGQMLEPHQLSEVGRQVLERQHQLIEAGYTPGSPLALRLFN